MRCDYFVIATIMLPDAGKMCIARAHTPCDFLLYYLINFIQPRAFHKFASKKKKKNENRLNSINIKNLCVKKHIYDIFYKS